MHLTKQILATVCKDYLKITYIKMLPLFVTDIIHDEYYVHFVKRVTFKKVCLSDSTHYNMYFMPDTKVRFVLF